VKPFTFSGVWWLPEEENLKVAGEATFTGDSRIKLVLHGTFDREFKPGTEISLSSYPIILGRTEAGESITLFSCQETSLNSQGEECEVDVTFIGNHFPDPQQILFNKVDLYYSYLPQWAGIFPYRGHQKPFDEVRAETSSVTVVVRPVRSSWSEFIKEADLTEVACIRCEVTHALPLDKWLAQFISPLQNLISLATQRPNSLVNIVGYVKQNSADLSNSNTSEIPVQIAFLPAIIPIPTNKPTFPGTILFSLQEVSANFSTVIDRWLRASDELASVYRLFFGVYYSTLPIDLEFLLITQAVEVYQDHRFDRTAMPEEKYQEMMKIILSACPEEQKQWLADKLEYSNHATFRQQLKNLITQTNVVLHPLLGINGKKRNELVEIIYDTRNYLTHHTKELASKAASGIELFYITRCLSLALWVCLMKELGFTTQQITPMIHKHEDFRLIPILQPQVNLEKLTN
jgi:hypothetical protein